VNASSFHVHCLCCGILYRYCYFSPRCKFPSFFLQPENTPVLTFLFHPSKWAHNTETSPSQIRSFVPFPSVHPSQRGFQKPYPASAVCFFPIHARGLYPLRPFPRPLLCRGPPGCWPQLFGLLFSRFFLLHPCHGPRCLPPPPLWPFPHQPTTPKRPFHSFVLLSPQGDLSIYFILHRPRVSFLLVSRTLASFPLRATSKDHLILETGVLRSLFPLSFFFFLKWWST